MASNPIPPGGGQIIALATKVLPGLTSLGGPLKITQITPAAFQAKLNAFITVDGDFNAARSAKQTASAAYTLAIAALHDWMGVTRNVLAGKFGSRWSTEWAQAGFITPTTSLPKRIEDQLSLALALTNFFTANPSYEVSSMLVTAAQATLLRNAALAAQQIITNAAMTLSTRGDEWTTAYDELAGAIRALIKILGATIADNDPRWLAFGLQMPATITTPGKPQNLSVTMDDAGALVVQCDPVPLATRYRWRMLVIGLQNEYQLVARSTAPLATITSVPPGQTVEIIVQAVNETLQGVASEPLIFTKPLPLAKDVELANAATVLTEAPGVRRNGNGHTAHSRAA